MLDHAAGPSLLALALRYDHAQVLPRLALVPLRISARSLESSLLHRLPAVLVKFGLALSAVLW